MNQEPRPAADETNHCVSAAPERGFYRNSVSTNLSPYPRQLCEAELHILNRDTN